MLLGTLGASLLGASLLVNLLTGKGAIATSQEHKANMSDKAQLEQGKAQLE